MPSWGKATSWRSTKPGKFLFHFEQRFHGGEFGIADIDMAADAGDTVGEFPFHGERGAALDVIESERLFAFRPNLDAFNECAGLIEARLANREHGVEVDMDVREGRRNEFASAVDHLSGTRRNLRSDFGDEAVVDGDIDGVVVTAYASVAKNQVHECASVRGIVTDEWRVGKSKPPLPAEPVFFLCGRVGHRILGTSLGEDGSRTL